MIDELPPGRRPIETRHVTEAASSSLELPQAGVDADAAYVVYPDRRVGDGAMKAAEKMYGI